MEFPSHHLADQAGRLLEMLDAFGWKLVLAESCTGGLVAAALVEIAGVSDYLCGTAAVYRSATKQQWLDVPEALLETHGAVSPQTTRCLAEQVLRKTPEADVASAVTGYLGPGAPVGREGLVYVAVALRQIEADAGPSVCVREHRIVDHQIRRHGDGAVAIRRTQQTRAAEQVIADLLASLEQQRR
jgi:PncC family amidohydrolase